jgi:HAMP domain-containing protein
MNDSILLQTQRSPVSIAHTCLPVNGSSVSHSSPALVPKKNKHFYQYGPYTLLLVLLLIILIIVAVVVSKVSSISAISLEPISTTTSSFSATTNIPQNTTEVSALANAIVLEHMLVHLRQYESRAIGTRAFNRTIDYLIEQLNRTNSFDVKKYYFPVARSELNGYPMLVALPNTSNMSIFTYPTDFVPMERSNEARNWSMIDGRPLSIVARFGCSLNDWNMTNKGDVVLVKRGSCTFTQKLWLAMNKQATACLIYNDGLTNERLAPLNNTRAPRNNTLPALFLSYEAGMRLIVENVSHVYLRLEFRLLPPMIVTNVCADTKTGNPNRTIVVGSHSDSVSSGELIFSMICFYC